MRKSGWLNAVLMCSTAMAAFTPMSVCSIDNGDAGGGGGGGGGAGDVFDDKGGGGTPPPAPAPDGGTPTPPPPSGGTPPPSPPPAPSPFAEGLSTEAPGEGQTSNRDYVTAKGFKDADAMANAYRELEKQLHGGKGYVKLPGEGASDAEIAAYRTAIGVPGAAADYEVNLPQPGEGEPGYELDTSLLDPLKEAALKAGVPKAAFAQLGDAFVKWQLDAIAADNLASDQEAKAFFDKQGKDADAARVNARKGAELVGFDRADIVAIQNAKRGDGTRIGADNLLEKLAKLGALAGEDVLAGGERRSFGVNSLAEAEAGIKAIIDNPEQAAKLRAKDPAVKATYDRLEQAQIYYKDREAKR